MKKQNHSEKNIIEPELRKDEIKNKSQDDQDKNRIEFDTKEIDESKEDLEFSEKTTNSITTDEVYYRPYKVSKRMGQRD